MAHIPIKSEVDAFVEEVLARFLETVTDRIFLMIQRDRDLMQEYLRLVKTGEHDRLNGDIGKAIREKLNLANDGENKDEPESTLIGTYTRHRLKKRG